MEKLKFWLEELNLIAKEFNREHEQFCEERDCKKLIWS